ncbi:hypothetical protein GA0061093_11760 [Rhodococcus qingshengii]|nr:hypothetical protein GA0061093_11760 [Rhodococcus qingshengii]
MIMRVTGKTAAAPVPFDAVTVKVNDPAVVGVPESAPLGESQSCRQGPGGDGEGGIGLPGPGEGVTVGLAENPGWRDAGQSR